jgi:recombination protein RecA
MKRVLSDDARAAALQAFITEQSSDDLPVFRLSDRTGLAVDAIRTGSPLLDAQLGVGGLPRGRVVELYGPEGSGKTTLALSVCAQAQRNGGYIGFVDAEHAIDPQHAANMGVDLDTAVIVQPDFGEQALRMVEQMCNQKIFDVIVIDSVASLVPKAELDGDLGDQKVGRQAAMMSQAMRRLVASVASSGAVVIFINQIREKIGVMYGNPETTPGGRALKFYSSVRLEIRSSPSKKIPNQENPIGQTCDVKIVKNKVAPPLKRASYDLYFATGIDWHGSLLDAAIELGVVSRAGASFTFAADGTKLAVGRANAVEALRTDTELRDRVEGLVYGTFSPAAPPAPADVCVECGAVGDDCACAEELIPTAS